MATAAENALFHRVRGDDWRWSFTTADTVSGWASPVVQIRTGPAQTDTLVASSITVGALTANVTITADFAAGTLAWHVQDTVTSSISAGFYYLEVEALVDGDKVTVLPARMLRVVDQVAVTP